MIFQEIQQDYLLDRYCQIEVQLVQHQLWDDTQQPIEIDGLQSLFNSRIQILNSQPKFFSKQYSQLQTLEDEISALIRTLQLKYASILQGYNQNTDILYSDFEKDNAEFIDQLICKSDDKLEIEKENQPQILAFCPYMQTFINILVLPVHNGRKANLQMYLLSDNISNESHSNLVFSAYNWISISISVDNQVFIIGGTIGNSYRDTKSAQILQFDYATQKTEKYCEMTIPRDVAASCIVQNYLYIVAGRDNSLNYITKMERINLKTQKIEIMKDCIAPAGQPSLVPYKDEYIYKFGGWKQRYVPNDTVERYDIRLDSWEQLFFLEQIQLNACMGAALIKNNQIILFGGWRQDFSCCTNQLTVFQIQEYEQEHILKKDHNLNPLLQCSGFWYNHVHYESEDKFYILENIQSTELNGTFLALIQRVLCYDKGIWKYIDIDGKFESFPHMAM